MYDTISDELFCPYCGKKQEANFFQTKDMECMLDSWSIEEIKKSVPKTKKYQNINIYTHCRDCKKWIDINI